MIREPLNLSLPGESRPWSRWFVPATQAFVVLGLAIRTVRYLLRFPLWPDESFLAASFIQSSFRDLLGTIDYHQVGPLFFLWIELSVVKILGFSEYSLRLFPFLCSLGSVFLFYHLARRLWRGAPLLLAVAIFAVAYYPIRHGAEIKPYATDLFISLVLLTLAIEWWRNPSPNPWLWCLAAAVPIAVGFSFPAVFIAGGISLGLLASVKKRGWRRSVIPYLIFNLALIGAFLVMYLISTGPQYKTESWLSGPPQKDASIHADKQGAWKKCFPPLKEPAKLAGWLIDTHTGRLFAYPNGGKHGGSALTFFCFTAGAIILYRRRRRNLLLIFLAPFALALVAAALHRYPYGYSARFNLYLAPIICLLSGLGAGGLISLIRREKLRFGVFTGFVTLLALLGISIIISDLSHPYKNREDVASRRFARRFWKEQARDAELVCVYTDLGRDFFPRLFEWGNSARYLCYQSIYSPTHRHGKHTPRWSSISTSRPLRCVVFSIPENLFPYARRDDPSWNRWLTDMTSRYELINREKYEINRGMKGQHETYEVYEFAPKTSRGVAAAD